MSDEEISDNGDFSGSEDEWQPDGENPSSTEVESEIEVDSTVSLPKTNRKRCIKKVAGPSLEGPKKRLSQTLRHKMFKKYNPPPKSANLKSSHSINTSLSAAVKSPRCKEKQSEEDSESSGDDYLVNPNDLDLKSSFFDIPPKSLDDEKPPEFDCNAGLRLSDSEEDEDFQEIENKNASEKSDSLPDELENILNTSSLKQMHDYAMNLESAKEHLRCLKYEAKKEQDVNVSQLLALGEKQEAKVGGVVKKRKKAADTDSESDWEEVEDMKSELNVTKEDIQVTVQLQDKTKEKKSLDIEAILKRKLNRIIKENQLYFHKVSLLCHIAHGIYCNKALNNPTLMAQALKLLPNKTCYPNGRTEIKYFESIAKWYKTAMAIKSNKMYPYFRTRPPIPISLAIQIKYKAAICKKDFVLIFIILLRAMGIQCRMVINLVPLPIRPAQSDLCKITMKKEPKDEKQDEKSKIKQENVNNSAKDDVKKSNKAGSESKGDQKAGCSVSLIKAGENKKRNENVTETVKTSGQTRKKQKLEGTKENSTRTQEKENEIKGLKSGDGNTGKNVAALKSEEKKSETSLKKLSEKVVFSKETQKAHTSAHFNKRDTNSEDTQKNEKLTLLASSGRSTRSKTKAKELSAQIANKIPQMDGTEDIVEKQSKSSRGRNIKFKFPKKHPNPPTDSEDEFAPSASKKMKPSSSVNKNKSIRQTKDKRVLSTDEEDVEKGKKMKNFMDIWIEVFAEEEDQWVTIDLFSGKVHCIDTIRKAATSPIAYVFAWNNDNTIKDVSARYCPQWHTVTRKLRIEQDWLDEAVRNYVSKKKSARDRKEDRELHKIHLEKPLPKTITEYKNHPLYVLERHLLKFEGIYPPNAPTLGFVRGEPVYARECVHTLHSREIWLKQARVVKPGQKPYKIVKARPKWDRLTNSVIKDQPLEIFGYWQTMQYEPPTAENGIVPRNAYGNVELFKKCMLPKKTVHIQLPGLNRVCKKLKIDCAPAVVGFDFHQGMCHPLMDGFVVCEEFADQAVAAWYQEQEEAERREEEKYQQRVYGNWKKLIKGLLIREKLKLKYNFEGVKYEEKEKIKRSKK